MDNFREKFGKPICVLLYAVGAFFAAKKKPLPLILLVLTHIGEYFGVARKLADEKGIDQLEAAANCVCFGFTWWLPLKKGE